MVLDQVVARTRLSISVDRQTFGAVLIWVVLCLRILLYGVVRVAKVPHLWICAHEEIAKLSLIISLKSIGVIHDSNREKNEAPIALCEIGYLCGKQWSRFFGIESGESGRNIPPHFPSVLSNRVVAPFMKVGEGSLNKRKEFGSSRSAVWQQIREPHGTCCRCFANILEDYIGLSFGSHVRNRDELRHPISNDVWSLIGLECYLLVRQSAFCCVSGAPRYIQVAPHEVQAYQADNSCNGRDPVEPFCNPKLPLPKISLIGIMLFVIFMSMGNRGMERGPSWLYMTGWLLGVASGVLIVITLFPFLAQFVAPHSKSGQYQTFPPIDTFPLRL
jgi:hypothetical protein